MNAKSSSTKSLQAVHDFLAANLPTTEGTKLVVCWSGGKDSTALLYAVARCASEIGQHGKVTALFVPYPRIICRTGSFAGMAEFWESQGIDLRILNHKHADPNPASNAPVCQQCKQVRRSVLRELYFNHENLFTLVLTTGHDAWDLAAYLLEAITCRMASTTKPDAYEKSDRFLEMMNKFLPVYRHPSGPLILRPLLHLGDDDILSIIREASVPFPFAGMPDLCPWLQQRKRLFQEYFAQNSLRFDFSSLLNTAQTAFSLPAVREYGRLAFETYLL